MNVSVIITCLNEELNIGSCLNSLISQDYAGGDWEIIIVDGGSVDSTQAIVNEYRQIHENVHLVVELKKGTAAGRNAGVKSAKYEYIAFIDADCEAPMTWLSVLINNYSRFKNKDKQIIAVGGMNISPEGSDLFVQAIGIALDSYLGSFNSVQGRRLQIPTYVSSLANLNVLYEREKVIEIGLYDESLRSEAEDADINYRLCSKSYKFLFIPDSFVWHKMRSTRFGWFKNMFRYGKGRARLLKRYPDMWRFHFILPILFLIGFSLIFLAPLSTIFFIPLLYFPTILIFSLILCLRKKLLILSYYVTLVYIIQHFGYALGEIYGLVNPRVK